MKTLIAASAILAALCAQAAFTMGGAGANGVQRTSDVAVQSFKLAFAPRAAVAPVLDGMLDDACWRDAVPITDYGACTLPQNPLNRIPKTEVRLVWDDKYLYVGAQCWEDTPENMASFLKIVNDGKRTFFDRDCIEMHIDGNNDEHTHFQCWLLANDEKNVHWNWDLGWGLLTDFNYGLNADWSISHSIGKDSWTVEARYALSHFELKPQVGYIFGVEPARFRYEKELFDKNTGASLGKNRGQWLAWGAQGTSHQRPGAYGKVVFVEKTPATVAEGLKLAYPDLDRRTILVQTGSEYAVFDRGKVSTLTYAEKARQLFAETAGAVAHYERFLGEVSNVVWKASAYAIGRTRKEIADFRALAAAATERKEVDIGFIGELEKKCGKWNGQFETAYWELVRDTMLAEGKPRVSVRLDPAPDAPALNSEFADCTLRPEERVRGETEWAKPLAIGRKKVFVTVNSTGGIDAWRLAQRMDIDATIFQSTGGDNAVGVSSDYYNEGHWFTAKKRQELERALKEKGPFDAYVFIGTRVQTWPAELQCWLLEQVLAGAKVLEKNGDAAPVIGRLKVDRELVAGLPQGMTKVGFAKGGGELDETYIPVNLGTNPYASSPFGRGTFARVATDVTAGWAHVTKGTPAWPTKPDNAFQDEYGFAYLVRNVMQLLGCREGRRAIDVGEGRAEIPAGAATTVPFRTAGAADWTGEVGWQVRDLSGKVVQRAVAAAGIPAGTNHISLALEPLDAGEYYVDATLYAPGRKVVDFASGRLVAAYRERFVRCGCSTNCRELVATPAIADFKLAAKTLYGVDEPVRATVRVSPAAADLAIRAEIRDVRQRILVRRDFAVDPTTGQAAVELKNVPEYDWTLANLDVSLYAGTRRLDRKTAEFFRHRGDVSDYMVFSTPPAPGGWFGKQRLAYEMYGGIDLFQVTYDMCQMGYNPAFMSFGGDAVLRDRIPGGAPDCGGSLTNPWWLRHLKARYGRHAAALREVNGRFISLGDDSGEPNDFPRNCPDWVPCWLDRQVRRIDGYEKSWRDRGVKRAGYEAMAQWLREYGIKGKPMDNTHYLRYFAWVRDAAVRRLAEGGFTKDQFAEVVSCFREVYGSVEKLARAANVKAAKWEEVTPELMKTAEWDPSPEFVNFLFWLRERYRRDIAKLNAAWTCDVGDFAEIPRGLVDEKLGEGVYTPSVDMQTFLEDAFVGQARAIAEGIHGADASIGLGFGASSLGNTFSEAVKHLDSVCPYGGFDVEMMRGQKHRYIGECVGIYGGRNVPEPMRVKRVWHGLFTGCNFNWFWCASYLYGDGTVDARKYGAMLETYREIKRGPAALVLRSRRDNCGVKVLVSRDAGHFAPILKDMATHAQARASFGQLIESLGVQYDSVTTEQVERGEILRDGTKVVVLPYLQAMRAREAGYLREFVQKGGTVIADARVGLFDEQGVPRAKPALDDVFGVTTGPKAMPVRRDIVVTNLVSRPATLVSALADASVKPAKATVCGRSSDGVGAFFVNDFGKGRAVLLNFNLAVLPFLEGRGELGGVREALERILAQAGLKPIAVMKDAAGATVTGTEFTRYERGGEIYLGVEKSGHAYEKFPMQAFVELDRKYWVYDVRAGRKVGFTARIPMTLKGLDVGLYALLPAEAKELKLDLPSTVAPGASLKATAKLGIADPKSQISETTDTRVFRWELIEDGKGDSREEYCAYPWRLKDAKGGKGATEWAIGYNVRPGTKLTVVVTDVATGLSASQVVTVR